MTTIALNLVLVLQDRRQATWETIVRVTFGTFMGVSSSSSSFSIRACRSSDRSEALLRLEWAGTTLHHSDKNDSSTAGGPKEGHRNAPSTIDAPSPIFATI